ncbi:hypothetical protein C0J52_24743 [Blattella germanica]|nr:hypothetical protein C0J52_24743 [Blattella germanica]
MEFHPGEKFEDVDSNRDDNTETIYAKEGAQNRNAHLGGQLPTLTNETNIVRMNKPDGQVGAPGNSFPINVVNVNQGNTGMVYDHRRIDQNNQYHFQTQVQNYEQIPPQFAPQTALGNEVNKRHHANSNEALTNAVGVITDNVQVGMLPPDSEQGPTLVYTEKVFLDQPPVYRVVKINNNPQDHEPRSGETTVDHNNNHPHVYLNPNNHNAMPNKNESNPAVKKVDLPFDRHSVAQEQRAVALKRLSGGRVVHRQSTKAQTANIRGGAENSVQAGSAPTHGSAEQVKFPATNLPNTSAAHINEQNALAGVVNNIPAVDDPHRQICVTYKPPVSQIPSFSTYAPARVNDKKEPVRKYKEILPKPEAQNVQFNPKYYSSDSTNMLANTDIQQRRTGGAPENNLPPAPGVYYGHPGNAMQAKVPDYLPHHRRQSIREAPGMSPVQTHPNKEALPMSSERVGPHQRALTYEPSKDQVATLGETQMSGQELAARHALLDDIALGRRLFIAAELENEALDLSMRGHPFHPMLPTILLPPFRYYPSWPMQTHEAPIGPNMLPIAHAANQEQEQQQHHHHHHHHQQQQQQAISPRFHPYGNNHHHRGVVHDQRVQPVGHLYPQPGPSAHDPRFVPQRPDLSSFYLQYVTAFKQYLQSRFFGHTPTRHFARPNNGPN